MTTATACTLQSMTEQSSTPGPNGNIFDFRTASHHVSSSGPLTPQFRVHPDYLSNGRRSLSGIASYAFGLGITLGLCSILAVELALHDQYIWRLPCFISVLCVFHFLEFDMTARYNPPDAKVSSYLLFSNGSAYNIAHATAMVETVVRAILQSSYRPSWLHLSFTLPTLQQLGVPEHQPWLIPMIGVFLVVMGQFMRSLAMKQAGTNFNHIVQSEKKEDHVLITTGVYSISRHPSYFGFFWWGLGTQMVLGNNFCLVMYALILWKFFSNRIMHEEKHLITFFDEAYVNYRKRTPVLIPFIS